MTKRSKKLLLFGLLLLFSIVVAALGLKYFPFTKVMKMPVAPETEFVNPQKTRGLAPHTLYYDFEMAPGKEMPGGFFKGLAHSGQYSVKAFGQNSFSVAVERTAGEIGTENLKAVALSAWVYVYPTTSEVKGHLVFTASNELGVNVCWQGVGVREPGVPKGKWFKISGYFDLTSVTFKPGYKLQVYFWNNSRADILVDDYMIVFGGPVDRRGDSALVDLTRPAGYVPRFNCPPFPVAYLEKTEAGALPGPKEIGPADHVIAGNFLDTGTDAVFVLRPDGRATAWAFCPENGGFRKTGVINTAALAPAMPVKKILKGTFLEGAGEQLVLSGEKGWLLAALTPPAGPCIAAGSLQTVARVLWKSATPAGALCVGDFNGDRRSEMMTVAETGAWQLMSFIQPSNSPGEWKVIASGTEPVKEWAGTGREISFTAGKFITPASSDQVLVVARDKRDGKCSYSVYSFNAGRKAWESAYPGQQDYCGKVIGFDTLKPADLFFPVKMADNRPVFLRLNRDWRFDLKAVTFSDTAFTIHSGFDFTGFDLDHNPKYYESLMIIPGHFGPGAEYSILVIGHMGRERHYESLLPDFSALYSVSKNNKGKK